MKLASLVLTMLRYRVASLLLPFFLLAPAVHGALGSFRWSYVAGIVALCASYVVATCLNDVFDLEVDRINHPTAPDRPLVSGSASPRQLLLIAAALALTALVASAATGWLGPAVIVASLGLNVAYSVPPVRLCARPVPAPLVLGIAYAGLPYGLGLSASGATPGWQDARLVACFVLLMAGRMLLKDFRDLRGDRAFGKRTFLLAYGKKATLIAVLACVLAGDALLVTSLGGDAVLIAVVESYFVVVLFQLYRLGQAPEVRAERVAIALGARMGNAVVLTTLGFFVLEAAGAAADERVVFVLVLAATFWGTFWYLASGLRELPGAASASASTTA